MAAVADYQYNPTRRYIENARILEQFLTRAFERVSESKICEAIHVEHPHAGRRLSIDLEDRLPLIDNPKTLMDHIANFAAAALGKPRILTPPEEQAFYDDAVTFQFDEDPVYKKMVEDRIIKSNSAYLKLVERIESKYPGCTVGEPEYLESERAVDLPLTYAPRLMQLER